jgi:predicted phage tail protein
MNTRPTFANFRQAVSGTVGAPTNFAASSSGSTVTLTWGPPASGTPSSYVIEAGSGNGLANLATVNTGSTATSFTTSGVANGYYVVRVRAAAGADVGPMSNEAGLRVGSCTTVPAAPGGLASVVSGSTVYLTWSLSSTATTYVLEAGSASGLANLASSDLHNELNAYSVAAVPRGTYFVRVRAKNACGTSGASPEVRLTVS